MVDRHPKVSSVGDRAHAVLRHLDRPRRTTPQRATIGWRLDEPHTCAKPLAIPALWGGIGACTFLAKHLSNKLSQQAYERARQQGDIVRIFLGAMIGVFAVVVSTDFGSSMGELGAPGAGDTSAGDTSGGDMSADDPAPIAMGAVVIAFASGLAVKPIYAAIETLANSLASRLSGK